MIEVTHLYKAFGSVVAVEDVSFRAGRGEILGLLGPNGAGKTTTLRILSGVFKADRGSAKINHLEVAENPLEAQRHIGVLGDGAGLYKRLTARENIAYFGRLHKLSERIIRHRTDELSERLGMRDILDRRCAGFSQGERMKTSLARALVHDPSTLILDEPTNGLDVKTNRALRDLLHHMRASGKCIVFSSHVMHEVTNLCDHVAVIAHGRVTAAGSIDEVVGLAERDNLESAFLYFTEKEEDREQQL